MESTSRFAHLLQPIRDMSKIWNIPIADELESYLQELEALVSSDPEEGFAKTNFAEAALLIQGSANIYSRKVELLYELAYHALDLIVSDQKKNEKGLNRKGAKSAWLWGSIPDDLETIDHLIKEGRGIDLEDGSQPAGRVAAMRRVPLWLLPRESTDRRRHEFRITSCTVHRTAAHILQESDAQLLDKLIAQDRVQRDGCEPLAPPPPRVVNELDEELQALLGQLPPNMRSAYREGEEEDLLDRNVRHSMRVLEEEAGMAAQDFGGDGICDMEGDVAAAQGDMSAIDAGGDVDAYTGEPIGEGGLTPGSAGKSGSVKVKVTPLPLASGKTPELPDNLEDHKRMVMNVPLEQKDPWELLQEHDTVGAGKESKDGKLATGKTWRKPSDLLLTSLDQLPDPGMMESLSDEARWEGDAVTAAALSTGGHPVEALFKAIAADGTKWNARCETQRLGFSGVWLEVEDLLVDCMQKRTKKRREQAIQEKLEMKARVNAGASPGKEGKLLREDVSDSSGTEDEAATPRRRESTGKDAMMNLMQKTPGSAGTPGAGTPGVMGGTPGGVPGVPGSAMPQDLILKEGMTEQDASVLEQRKEVARLEAEIEAAQKKYENTIRVHLERNNRMLLEGNTKDMPQLYANVRAWQDMLEPMLKEQHKRTDFDFDKYCQSMLAHMGPENGPPIPFTQLIAGVPRWEICRRFLTCLVLTNHGNTDIVAETEADRLNNWALRLVNAQKELPSLEDDPDEDKKKAKKGKKGGKAPIADAEEVADAIPIADEETVQLATAAPAKKAAKKTGTPLKERPVEEVGKTAASQAGTPGTEKQMRLRKKSKVDAEN